MSQISLLRADVKKLPFPDKFSDRAFALDLVEHLHPWELDEALAEIRRTVMPNGYLVIPTMPNRWYYAFGYPIYRTLNLFRGKRLPRDPRLRWKYVPHVHVNEQDPISLKHALQRAGFSATVWLQPMDNLEKGSALEYRLERVLSQVFPLKLIFCSSIFAIATPVQPEAKFGARWPR
jgi:ubiquinone/menaquinone biosynthesis C-methylase UbiE